MAPSPFAGRDGTALSSRQHLHAGCDFLK
jgi:hypothetical protein